MPAPTGPGVVPLRLTWRTWSRAAASALVCLAGGVVALTAGANPVLRTVGAAVGAALLVGLLDLVVAVRGWRMTPAAIEVGSLRSPTRSIAGADGIAVSLAIGLTASIRITGPNGERRLAVNPLVSWRDLRRWFDAAPD